jgi:hypothetical protein
MRSVESARCANIADAQQPEGQFEGPSTNYRKAKRFRPKKFELLPVTSTWAADLFTLICFRR